MRWGLNMFLGRVDLWEDGYEADHDSLQCKEKQWLEMLDNLIMFVLPRPRQRGSWQMSWPRWSCPGTTTVPAKQASVTVFRCANHLLLSSCNKVSKLVSEWVILVSLYSLYSLKDYTVCTVYTNERNSASSGRFLGIFLFVYKQINVKRYSLKNWQIRNQIQIQIIIR